jgi:hypothetical protein
MAVIRVIRLAEGRQGSASSDSASREYVMRFRVVTNDPNDGPQVVSFGVDPTTGVAVPNRGDRYVWGHDADLACRCNQLEIQQHADNPRVWDVTAHYTTQARDRNDNPLQRPTSIRFGFAKFERVAERDVNGQAIVNSAGSYFDPPPMMDDSRPTIVMVRNEPSFNAALAMDYQDAVNSAAWFGFPAGTAKVSQISASDHWENDVYYWEVTYEFEIRREGWTLRLLDQGRYERSGTNVRPILDANGDPVQDPVLLNGSGSRLDNPGPSTAVFLNFDVYKQRDLNALGLP